MRGKFIKPRGNVPIQRMPNGDEQTRVGLFGEDGAPKPIEIVTDPCNGWVGIMLDGELRWVPASSGAITDPVPPPTNPLQNALASAVQHALRSRMPLDVPVQQEANAPAAPAPDPLQSLINSIFSGKK